jgi:SAM-dependent methyltransferase
MTNWDHYYLHPYRTAAYSRKITSRILVNLIKRFTSGKEPLLIAEIGGANSCFLDFIQDELRPAQYHIIDNNELGLNLLKSRLDIGHTVFLHHQDVLTLGKNNELLVDVAFSVGLIEHFSSDKLAKVIQAHLNILKPEGIAIITFPTPTFLYKFARKISEMMNLWIFHDETPLKVKNVLRIIEPMGKLLYYGINWLIVFTQGIVVVEKPFDS